MEVLQRCRGHVYCKAGYVYVKNGNSRSLRCTQSRQGCPGTAKLLDDDLQLLKPHDHPSNNAEVDKIRVTASLKRDAADHKKDSETNVVKVVRHNRLIKPTEVEVRQPLLMDSPVAVLTPLEKIRRQDQVLVSALATKQRILAEVVGGPDNLNDELNAATDSLNESTIGPHFKPQSREQIMAAIVQANRLLESINMEMKLTREDDKDDGDSDKASSEDSAMYPSVACFQLTTIVAPLMRHLTSLLHSIQEQELELGQAKRDLLKYRAQHRKQTQAQAAASQASILLKKSGDTSGEPSNKSSSSDAAVFMRPESAEQHIYLSPQESVPAVIVGHGSSSEETLTEGSKTHSPSVKTPESPPADSRILSPGAFSLRPDPDPISSSLPIHLSASCSEIGIGSGFGGLAPNSAEEEREEIWKLRSSSTLPEDLNSTKAKSDVNMKE